MRRERSKRGTCALVVSVASMLALGAGAACSDFRNEGGSPSPDASTDSAVGVEGGGADAGGNGDAPADGAATDSSSPADSGEAAPTGDGGVCTSQTCTVTTLMPALYGPAALAVDASYVYWLEVATTIPQSGGSGQLARVKKDGSCADRSCAEIIDPYALSGTFEGELIYDNLVAVGPADVCYAQSFNAQSEHQITCFALNSFTPTSIDQDYGECDSLWMGAGAVFWSLASTSATTSDGSIRTRPLAASDGGAAPYVASSRPYPTGVLADGTGVVWSELGLGDAGGAVVVAGADGGVSPLVSGRGAPVAVAEYGAYVYWLDDAAHTVLRTTRAGGGAVDQIANTDANAFALVVDPSGVYWASAGLANPDGTVAHAPLDPGGPTTVMMSNVAGIQALAIDGTRVYVAAVGTKLNAGGSILAMNKTR